METVKSITEITETLSTRGFPVKVLCSDFNTYIAKHNMGYTPANRLKNELLGHFFLKSWGLKTPPVKLVYVKDAHIEKHLSTTCQYKYFRNIPCFGSRFLDRATLFNQFLQSLTYKEYNSIKNSNDILKIALFDYWISNEDRTPNNFNLLLNPERSGNYIYAIDHEDFFNSNNLPSGLVPLTEEDSILSAPEVKVLIKWLKPSNDTIKKMEENYYLCTNKCKQQLDGFLSDIPAEWQINKAELKRQLLSNLFSKSWCTTAFKEFSLHLAKNTKK